VLFTNVRSRIAGPLARNPLVFLGKSSLEVFCVHVLFVFGALALVGDGSHASSTSQFAILTVTLAGLFAFAYARADLRSQPKAQERVATAFLSSLATPASCSEFRPGFFLVKNFVWMLAQKLF
jgi:peptidoglycan/LPS O-acetylase OafA/YrhL